MNSWKKPHHSKESNIFRKRERKQRTERGKEPEKNTGRKREKKGGMGEREGGKKEEKKEGRKAGRKSKPDIVPLNPFCTEQRNWSLKCAFSHIDH